MNEKHILIADADTRAKEEFRQALGETWKITAVSSGAAALDEMEKHPASVVIANLDLTDLDGGELLSRIRRKYPESIRFIAARTADKERVMKTARGAHQFLSKPYDTITIKDAIERAVALDVWIASDRLRELISRIRSLPTIPTLYLEIVAALRDPDATTEQIGAIISKDMAMMTKMLQLLNSACFGLTREISDPAEAVGILGFETIKSMVMTIKLLNQYDKLKPEHFPIDRLWTHSTAVARTARQLTLLETGDRALADAAFTAGLMHDLGKIVLAANFEDKYAGALLVGHKHRIPAWEIEKDVFGATHGEIGAYLLGLWGMPLNLMEATALHHDPSRSENKAFSPLTAVHVANVLERELSPDELGMTAPKLDEAYLEGLGLLHQVKIWRTAVSTRDGAIPAENTEVTEPASAAPAEPIRLATKPSAPRIKLQQPEPAGFFSSKKGIFAVAGVGVGVLSLVAWITFGQPTPQLEQSQLAQKDPAPVTPAATEPPPVTSTATPAPVASENEPAKETGIAVEKPSDTSPAILAALPEVVARARSSTNSSTPTVATAPKETALADFKLQGIMYSATDPAAIINGKTVRPDDKIGGAVVISITASNIVLESHDQRRTLTIK